MRRIAWALLALALAAPWAASAVAPPAASPAAAAGVAGRVTPKRPAPIQGFALADVQVRGGQERLRLQGCHEAWPAATADRLHASPPLAPQLDAAGEFAANHAQNSAYLLSLEPERLLWSFRCDWVGAAAVCGGK